MAAIQLSIADPCHENWDQMLPEEKGRFCLSCQKTVVDFTNMSDGQIFDYFKSYTGSTCGQFASQQLDRQIAKPKTHFIGRWKYFWQILLPAVFAFHKSTAQPKLMGKVAPKVVCKADSSKPVTIRMGMVAPMHYEKPSYKIKGQLTDINGNPLGMATVRSCAHTISADSNGSFSINIKPQDGLEISHVGYETRSLTWDSLRTHIKKLDVIKATNTIVVEVEIPLNERVVEMDEVVVAGNIDKRSYTTFAGGITMVKSSNLISQERVITPKNEVALKVFPNPVQPGQEYKINFVAAKNRNYVVRITDANGRILQEEKISAEKTERSVIVIGVAPQQAGIYFINVLETNNKKDKGLTGKIVVQ